MKRVLLFLATNLAVMLVLSLFTSLLGVNRFLTAKGLDLGMLLAFSAVIGFGGAIISLLMSKFMAKWSTGARGIESPANSTEFWLVDTAVSYTHLRAHETVLAFVFRLLLGKKK